MNSKCFFALCCILLVSFPTEISAIRPKTTMSKMANGRWPDLNRGRRRDDSCAQMQAEQIQAIGCRQTSIFRHTDSDRFIFIFIFRQKQAEPDAESRVKPKQVVDVEMLHITTQDIVRLGLHLASQIKKLPSYRALSTQKKTDRRELMKSPRSRGGNGGQYPVHK